jgi:osmotically-inducible protein OsmY
MTSRFLFLAAAVAASMACREDSAAQPQQAPQYAQTHSSGASSPRGPLSNVVVPRNPADRSIRRELNLAIDRDPDLKYRDLSFIVGNGDVNVTGIVRSESERERINALAMSIPGVKSIANAVRVAP